MKSQIGKLKYIFVITLAVCCALITGWQWLYEVPQKKCEAAGNWFSFRYRKCYEPVSVATFTHRKPGEPAQVDFHDADRKASNAEAASH